MVTSNTTYVTLFSLLSALIYRYLRTKAGGPKLPPGPKPWPLVGNIFDLPPKHVPEHEHWLKHKDQYGSVSSITIMGEIMVILNDRDAAHEILGTMSAHTSGRPVTKFLRACGFDKFFTQQPYDDELRQSRRLLHDFMGSPSKASFYNDVQEVEVGRFLLRMLDKPEGLFSHIKTLTGAIILKIVYGYSAESSKPDPLIRMIEALEHNFDAAAKPWTWLPDIIPFAQNLPGWIPGIQFIETARRFRETNREVIDTPFAFVQRQIANGVDQSSAISRLLELHSECNREGILERAAANLYIGGADVVDSTVVTFFGAMVMHPEIQKKAQMEIDSVVGEGRLPTFGDQEKLPYCNAIFKESYRSTTTAPLGAISVAEKDIIWKEHFIPKGSTIVPAAWWFRNDPAVYKDPDLFDPERFLSPRNEPEVGKTLFGFGRRACPGRYLADATIFLTIVQTLAAFDIRKSVDERGVEIDIHLEAQPGTIGRPGEFPYRLTPRSAEAIEWVRDIGRKHPWEASELYPSEKMSAVH